VAGFGRTRSLARPSAGWRLAAVGTNDHLTDMIHGAFQQSLESLRRFVEDKLPWDAA